METRTMQSKQLYIKKAVRCTKAHTGTDHKFLLYATLPCISPKLQHDSNFTGYTKTPSLKFYIRDKNKGDRKKNQNRSCHDQYLQQLQGNNNKSQKPKKDKEYNELGNCGTSYKEQKQCL